MSTTGKIVLAVAGIIVSIALLVLTAILAEEAIITPIAAVAFTLVSVIALIAAICYAAKLDYETAGYRCRKCGNTFKPTFVEYIMAPHSVTTRYLRCPECKKKSLCKRINIKNNDND